MHPRRPGVFLEGNGPHNATVSANKGNVHMNTALGTFSKIATTGTLNGTNGSVPFPVSWNCGGSFSKP